MGGNMQDKSGGNIMSETKPESKIMDTLKVYQWSEFKELNGWRETVPEYVKDYVPVNVYMR
jgi:hypothetical protein